MKTLRTSLMFAMFVGLAFVGGALMTSRPADAETASAPVRIVSPLPLPVTGTATVAGAVAATQSGSWVVSIGGQPVAVRNIDERGRTPYVGRGSCFGDGESGVGICNATLPAVPAGMRLVVEHVTAEMRVPPNVAVFRLVGTGGFFASKFSGRDVPGPFQVDYWPVNEVVLDYVEPAASPSFQALAAGRINMDVTVTGYLVAL